MSGLLYQLDQLKNVYDVDCKKEITSKMRVNQRKSISLMFHDNVLQIVKDLHNGLEPLKAISLLHNLNFYLINVQNEEL